MMKHRASLLAAMAAGLTGGAVLEYPYYNTGEGMPDPPTPAQTKRWRDQRGYPETGTGKRQGERVARQVRRALGDPFAASNKCIERIKERLARTSTSSFNAKEKS